MSPAELKRITLVRTFVANGQARELRKSRYLTLKEVAEAVGTSRSTVHRWEMAEAVPNSMHALLWADALGLTEAA